MGLPVNKGTLFWGCLEKKKKAELFNGDLRFSFLITDLWNHLSGDAAGDPEGMEEVKTEQMSPAAAAQRCWTPAPGAGGTGRMKNQL